MSESNPNYIKGDNTESLTGNDDAPLKETVSETNILKPRTSSTNVENVTDRPKGTGGLDSLGRGNLLIEDN